MTNDYFSDGNGHVRILLHPAKLQVYTIIDESDLEKVMPFNWRLLCSGHRYHMPYAVTEALQSGKLCRKSMHRTILETESPRIDHINGDGLDNRRCNLRPATQAQNLQNRGKQINNTSGFKGVSKASNSTWKAMIHKNGKDYYLGSYPDKEQAARAYDTKAKELFGEFAKLNFND